MPPRCEFRMKVSSKLRLTWETKYKFHRLHEKPNYPLHAKSSRIYISLQEQLYEPQVLVQDAFGWHAFTLTA